MTVNDKQEAPLETHSMQFQDNFNKMKSCVAEESFSFFKPKGEYEDNGAFFCENLDFENDDEPSPPPPKVQKLNETTSTATFPISKVKYVRKAYKRKWI